MSKFDKARQRMLSRPKDYTYTEAKYLLSQIGFEEYNKGRTSGSRVKFFRKQDERIIVMKNILEYKGYHAKIEFDSEEFVLRGKIEGINDLVNFECKDISNVENEFHAAVDDYLDFCKEVGKEPDKEYKGTFNIRISPELHKKLVVVAVRNGDTLNATVEKALTEYVTV